MHEILLKNKWLLIKKSFINVCKININRSCLYAFIVLFVMSNVVVAIDDNPIETTNLSEIVRGVVDETMSAANQVLCSHFVFEDKSNAPQQASHVAAPVSAVHISEAALEEKPHLTNSVDLPVATPYVNMPELVQEGLQPNVPDDVSVGAVEKTKMVENSLASKETVSPKTEESPQASIPSAPVQPSSEKNKGFNWGKWTGKNLIVSGYKKVEKLVSESAKAQRADTSKSSFSNLQPIGSSSQANAENAQAEHSVDAPQGDAGSAILPEAVLSVPAAIDISKIEEPNVSITAALPAANVQIEESHLVLTTSDTPRVEYTNVSVNIPDCDIAQYYETHYEGIDKAKEFIQVSNAQALPDMLHDDALKSQASENLVESLPQATDLLAQNNELLVQTISNSVLSSTVSDMNSEDASVQKQDVQTPDVSTKSSNVNPVGELQTSNDGINISTQESIITSTDDNAASRQMTECDTTIKNSSAPADLVVSSSDDSIMSWLYIAGGAVTASLISYKLYNYVKNRMASPERLVTAIIASTDLDCLQSVYADILELTGTPVAGRGKPKLSSAHIRNLMLFVEGLGNAQDRQIMIAVMLHKFEMCAADKMKLITILKKAL